MSDLKITVDHLKNYLGTGLECKGYGRLISVRDWIGWCGEFKDKTGSVNIPLSSIHPICYRLSDLDKEIEHNRERFVPIVKMLELATTQIWGEPIEMIFTPEILTKGDSTGIIAYNDTERVSFTADFDGTRKDFALYMDGSEMMLDKLCLFQKLFEWHFWPFGDEYFEQGLVIDKMKITKK